MKDTQMSAAALYDGGWRASDRDQLQAEYQLTDQETDELCKALAAMTQSELVSKYQDYIDAAYETWYLNGALYIEARNDGHQVFYSVPGVYESGSTKPISIVEMETARHNGERIK
jgi:phage/plasmid-associated DNA primase